MPARLNRRRYREIVATLKEVISDPKATRMQRLRATETLLGVYDRHDRHEERKAAQRRTEAAETRRRDEVPEEAQEPTGESVDAFLARIRAERTPEEIRTRD